MICLQKYPIEQGQCLKMSTFDLHGSQTFEGYSTLQPVGGFKQDIHNDDALTVDLGQGFFLNRKYGFNNRTFLVTSLAVSSNWANSFCSSSAFWFWQIALLPWREKKGDIDMVK